MNGNALRLRGAPKKAFDPYAPFQEIGGHKYAVQSPKKPYSLQKAGADIYRFETRVGDIQSPPDPLARHRVEFSSSVHEVMPFRTELWWSYAFMIEDTYPAYPGFIVIGQIHATEDAADVFSSPILTVYYLGGTLNVNYLGDASPTTSVNPTMITAYSWPSVPGTWVRIVHRFRLDPFGTGQLQSWKDGVEMCNLSGLTLGLNDAVGPYMKWGAYCNNADQLALRIANFEWGAANLFDRVGNPLPIA